MKKILILFSFLMAANLVMTTYYGLMLKNAEVLVENNALQEVMEKELDKKIDYLVSDFRFIPSLMEKEEIVYNLDIYQNFSTFEQDILLPPPDFFRYSS